ncbi:MAG: Proline--tRNA ligase [Actinobacteria bacterium ADurb.Bin346]|nr:MAG: Proline--tRNA ligase [Actinobacteria bacterium ADurb.Bin346]
MVRYSEYFLTTLKEDLSNKEIASYSLSHRAGLIRKIASGIYAFLPLGYRVLKKIENIVREEMNRAGAIEMLMPAVQPADLWVESGRWQIYGPELFRLKDRNDRDFCLGPTHEELFTSLAHVDIKSYKNMPLNLYQIQVKFRDEIRPRYGILRAREFIMKDAYSFSSNEEDLDIIYNKMFEAYCRILERLSLKYFPVEADTGLIGGKSSHEFIILAGSGEDELLYCPECGYAANYEMAKFTPSQKKNGNIETPQETKEVHTPSIANIKSLSAFLNVPAEKIIKTMLLKDNDGNLFYVLVAGNREINIQKVQNCAGTALELIDSQTDDTGIAIGFIGPLGLDKNVRVYADNSLKGSVNMVAGANKKDYHIKNVCPGRDFNPDIWGDFSFPLDGDLCSVCGKPVKFEKGIEIGHIFKLGTKYSEKMDAMFLDSNGKLNPIIMGCYGIGVSRILAASIEQLHDDKGIIWPLSIAPFMVNLIAINMEDVKIAEAAEFIYSELAGAGIEVLFDDRNCRAGVKFKDSDLIGIPVKVVVGKNFLENKKLEIELRKDSGKIALDLENTIKFIKEYPQNNLF